MTEPSALLNDSRYINEEERKAGIPIDPTLQKKTITTYNKRSDTVSGFFRDYSSDEETSDSDDEKTPKKSTLSSSGNKLKQIGPATLKQNISVAYEGEERIKRDESDSSDSDSDSEEEFDSKDLIYNDIISFSKTLGSEKNVNLEEAKKIFNLLKDSEKDKYSPQSWYSLTKPEKIIYINSVKNNMTVQDLIYLRFPDLTPEELFEAEMLLINMKNTYDKSTWDRSILWKKLRDADKQTIIKTAKAVAKRNAEMNKRGGARRNKKRTTIRRKKSNTSKKRQYKKTGFGISKKRKTAKKTMRRVKRR